MAAHGFSALSAQQPLTRRTAFQNEQLIGEHAGGLRSVDSTWQKLSLNCVKIAYLP